jgi:hypothetical protein
MSFEALNLDIDEKVIFEVRKHWIVFVGYGLGLVFVALLPFAFIALFKIFPITFTSVSIPGNVYALGLYLYSIWLLILWISFFASWTTFYLDVWYVTEKRIIIVDQKKLFDREISNIRFDKVQDVTVDVHGIIPTFLDFGNVKVQTASEDNTEFVITTVRHPEEVRRIIFGQHNEVGDKK